MRQFIAITVVIVGLGVVGFAEHDGAKAVKNVVVYQQQGRFGGWPANHGMWAWGDEIVVGFEAGHYKYSETSHAIDYSRPAEHLLARSLDGGETWKLEKPKSLLPPPGTKMANVPTESGGKPATDCPGGIDFAHPDFAMTIRMASHQKGPSRFYYSYDRGKSWSGPFKFPDFGEAGLAARTDYLVNSKHDLTAFVTASKPNAREGRPICVRTRDGGKTWSLVAFIGPQPPGEGLRDYAVIGAFVGGQHSHCFPAASLDRGLSLRRRGPLVDVQEHPGTGYRARESSEFSEVEGWAAGDHLRFPG